MARTRGSISDENPGRCRPAARRRRPPPRCRSGGGRRAAAGRSAMASDGAVRRQVHRVDRRPVDQHQRGQGAAARGGRPAAPPGPASHSTSPLCSRKRVGARPGTRGRRAARRRCPGSRARAKTVKRAASARAARCAATCVAQVVGVDGDLARRRRGPARRRPGPAACRPAPAAGAWAGGRSAAPGACRSRRPGSCRAGWRPRSVIVPELGGQARRTRRSSSSQPGLHLPRATAPPRPPARQRGPPARMSMGSFSVSYS